MTFAFIPFSLVEIEHDTGVELPRTRAHGQTIERREAHRAFHALSRRRWHTWTLHYRDVRPRPALWRFPVRPRPDVSRRTRRRGREIRSAAHPLRRAAPELQAIGDSRDDLGGKAVSKQATCRRCGCRVKITRIGLGYWADEGGERYETFKSADDRIIHDGRFTVVRPAVHNAMPDRRRQSSADLLAQER